MGFSVCSLSFVAAIAVASAVVWMLGSANPSTPAGYVGYLTKGAVFGKSRFYGTQRGPTSSGRTWLVRVRNISITPYTYTDDFSRKSARSKRGRRRESPTPCGPFAAS
jgi:hypothetical protein